MAYSGVPGVVVQSFYHSKKCYNIGLNEKLKKKFDYQPPPPMKQIDTNYDHYLNKNRKELGNFRCMRFDRFQVKIQLAG